MTNNVDRWDESIPEDLVQIMAEKKGVSPDTIRLLHRHELFADYVLIEAGNRLMEAMTQSYEAKRDPHPVLSQTIAALKSLSPVQIAQDISDAIDEMWKGE